MVVIGGQVFAVVPKDDPIMRFMVEFDPDHIELTYGALDAFSVGLETSTSTSPFNGDAKYRQWAIGLESALGLFGTPGDPRWVCPD